MTTSRIRPLVVAYNLQGLIAAKYGKVSFNDSDSKLNRISLTTCPSQQVMFLLRADPAYPEFRRVVTLAARSNCRMFSLAQYELLLRIVIEVIFWHLSLANCSHCRTGPSQLWAEVAVIDKIRQTKISCLAAYHSCTSAGIMRLIDR